MNRDGRLQRRVLLLRIPTRSRASPPHHASRLGDGSAAAQRGQARFADHVANPSWSPAPPVSALADIAFCANAAREGSPTPRVHTIRSIRIAPLLLAAET